jgi:hypothetical protein
MKFRTRLAAWLVGGAGVGVVIISVVTIWLSAPGPDRAEASRMVFTAALPLLGTWVGTVLAFYFAKGNLEAATDSVTRISGLKSPGEPVKASMIRRKDFNPAYVLPDGAEAKDVLLGELHKLMSDTGKGRIPILTSGDVVKWIVHDSLIVEYVAGQDFPITDPAFATKSLADLFTDQKAKRMASAFTFVAVRANLGTARDEMSALANCNDVFVTQNGRSTEAVLGWLPNTLLATVDSSGS